MRLYLLLFGLLFFSQCKDSCDEGDCGPNGVCLLGDCECDEGYSGSDCSIADCDYLHKQDSLNLVAIYNSTGGPSWTNTWNLSEPISSWYGIQVNNCGLVSHIDLDGEADFDVTCCDGNGLSGILPPLVFSKLEFFNCSYNQISGEIPSLDNVPALSSFVCLGNSIAGEIPSLNNVPALEIFSCSNNQIIGEIPTLDNLPLLEVFSCYENQLYGEIPNLDNVPFLEIFSCADNQITRPIPLLDNVPRLTSFRCSSNLIIGEIPFLHNVPSLTYFDCSLNRITGAIPSLNNVSELDFFLCYKNQIVGEIPALDNVPDLSLWCYNNQLTGCHPQNACSIASYNAYSNPSLPWQGETSELCSGASQIGAPCEKDGLAGTIDENCDCVI